MDAVWPNGELYFDDDEAVKKAMGGGSGRTVSNWNLLRPGTLVNLITNSRKGGFASDDIADAKTKLMGGSFVVLKGEVVHVHHETNNFDNGDARQLLAAVLQRDLKDVPKLNAPVLNTPKEEEVCTRT